MRTVYIERVIQKYSTSDPTYLYDNPVDPQDVLVLRRATATHENAAANDPIQIGVYVGKVHHPLEDLDITTTRNLVTVSGQIPLGAGCQVYGYYPNIANDEEMRLYVFGELWDLEDWRAERHPELPGRRA